MAIDNLFSMAAEKDISYFKKNPTKLAQVLSQADKLWQMSYGKSPKLQRSVWGVKTAAMIMRLQNLLDDVTPYLTPEQRSKNDKFFEEHGLPKGTKWGTMNPSSTNWNTGGGAIDWSDVSNQ